MNTVKQNPLQYKVRHNLLATNVFVAQNSLFHTTSGILFYTLLHYNFIPVNLTNSVYTSLCSFKIIAFIAQLNFLNASPHSPTEMGRSMMS